MSTIVVGVDGSKGSLAALEFAVAEARRREAEVKAVSAWRVPAAAYHSGWVPIPIQSSDFEDPARAVLERSIASLNGQVGNVKITPVVREGQAADVLTEEARGADLLVVGSRGLGGFRGLLLGSVSQQCAHHTPCPIAIVPPPPENES